MRRRCPPMGPSCAPRRRGRLALLALLALAGCRTGPRNEAPAVPVSPTVAGRPAASFASSAEAKSAFTRTSPDGRFAATLEDAAWLRFEGDEATLLARYRGYFEFGYTGFQVSQRSKVHSAPTAETYVLEDSHGARVEGKPLTWEGSVRPVDYEWPARFGISFRHTLTSDTRWIRLTRLSTGDRLEWTFEPGVVPPR